MKVEASRPHRKKTFKRIDCCAAEQEKPDNRGREDKKRYKTLIENMPCAVYSTLPGETGPATFMFDKWKDLTGHSPEELCRDPEAWARCIHPDDRKRAASTYAQARTNEAPYNLEYRFVHKDTGQIRHVRDQGFLSRNEQGATIRVDGIITDITEFKEAQETEPKEACEELDHAHRLLKAITDSPKGVIIFAVDKQYRYLSFNKNHEQVMKDGYGVRMALGMNLFDCMTNADDRTKAKANIDRALSGESHTTIEEYGDVIRAYYETVYSPIADTVGEIIGATVYSTDITKQRTAENALRDSEELHRVTLDSISDTVLITDDAGAFTYICPNVSFIFGYSRAEVKALGDISGLLGENIFDPQELRTRHEISNIEMEVTSKAGKRRTLLVNVKRVSIQGGTVLYSCRDISERKRAEDALRENARLNQILLDSMPCVAMLIRPHTREIVASNEAAVKIGAVPGKTCYQTWRQSETPCPWCSAPELWATGKSQRCELEGLGRTWDAHWIPASDDLYMHYAFDITERKQAEEKMRQRQAELIHVSRLSTIGQMASELAHELNQPLCAMLTHLEGCLSMIKSDSSDMDRIIEKLETAVKQTDRAGKIVARVKGFAMKGRGKRSAVLVNDVVRDAIEFAIADLRHKHITVELDVDERIRSVFADPIQIEQVVLNLIHNASDAMEDTPKEHRKLTISTRMLANAVEITVKDSGKGIDKADANSIFESFVTTKPEGLGVGLSICQSIVESHGGRIFFKDNPDHGVTFCFTLPLRGKIT